MNPDTASTRGELAPPELETMELTIDGEIGTLTLNRPDALNAMNPDMISELPRIASWLADSAPLRALIVTGAGRAFCAGGDVNWFSGGLDDDSIDLPSNVRHGADVLHQGIIDFRRIPFPVVAAVNGPAAGAGLSLALMCDTRIASEDAFFAVAYGRIGASPDGGMTYFLPRILGPSRAIELMLNDPNLTAQDALEAGIVAKVVPADELLPAAQRKAAKLAAMAPHYVRMAKSLIAQSLDNTLADHLQVERHGIADSMATEDLANGVRAFLAGEETTFTGR
ncbi:MAG: enoyl-CoA hydratase/isomerase family protein [Solirubrobacterales bacterium]